MGLWPLWTGLLSYLWSHRARLISFADVKPYDVQLSCFWHGLGMDHNQTIYVAIGDGKELRGGVGDVLIFEYDTKTGCKRFIKSVCDILKDAGNLGPNIHWPHAEGVAKVHSDIIEHNGIMYFATHDHHSLDGLEDHRGAHFISFNPVTRLFTDLSRFCDGGVAIANEGIIGLNILPSEHALVGWTFPYGHILLHDLTTGVTTKYSRGLPDDVVADVARVVITTGGGNIFAAYAGNQSPHCLFKLNRESKRLCRTRYTFDLGLLQGLAETSDGNIYLADTDGQLYSLDANTEELRRLGSILPPDREARGERVVRLRNLTLSRDERKLFTIPCKTEGGAGAYHLYEYDIATGTKTDLANLRTLLKGSVITGNGVMDEKNRMYLSCYFGSDRERYSDLSDIVRIDVSDRVLPTANPPVFQPYGGRFTDPVTVSLSTSTPGAEIRYTLDGNDPQSCSPLYTFPLTLDCKTFIRARAFTEGLVKSRVAYAVFIQG